MISVVMTYFARKALLDLTLKSITQSIVKDFEIIIVDDGSPEPLVCNQARVIRIDPENKWWHNPCIPYNIGFKEAKGDIIVIQNPECFHHNDVLLYAKNNTKPNIYLSFACYAINPQQTIDFKRGVCPEFEHKMFGGKEKNGWYNHSGHYNRGLHFCSSITRGDLDALGGFDERYANGVSFDDDAFIREIKRRDMDVQIIDEPFVIHQYHLPFTYRREGWKVLHEINKNIYETT